MLRQRLISWITRNFPVIDKFFAKRKRSLRKCDKSERSKHSHLKQLTFICLYINRGFLQIYLMHCQTVLGCIHFANDLCRVDVIKTEQHQEPVNNNSKFNFFSYHFIWRNIVLFCRKFHINGEFSIRVYQTACPHNLFTKNLFFFEIIGDNDIDEIR